MPKHHEVRHLPYSVDQMYALVADIARYPEFVPWISAMRVRSDTATETVADMVVGFKGLRETFTSRVHKRAPHEIIVDYVDGPLKYLRNEWRFADAAAAGKGQGVLIDFMVDFAFRSRMFEMLAGQLFDTALRKMIGAFEARADALYGSGSINSSAQTAA